jgi:hypothetical protein
LSYGQKKRRQRSKKAGERQEVIAREKLLSTFTPELVMEIRFASEAAVKKAEKEMAYAA